MGTPGMLSWDSQEVQDNLAYWQRKRVHGKGSGFRG